VIDGDSADTTINGLPLIILVVIYCGRPAGKCLREQVNFNEVLRSHWAQNKDNEENENDQPKTNGGPGTEQRVRRKN
jgi:hypothetical protein